MNKLFLVGTNPHVPTRNCPRNQRKVQEQSTRHFNVNQAEVKRRKKKESSRWRRMLKKFSVAYFVRNYFGKWMVSSQVKVGQMLQMRFYGIQKTQYMVCQIIGAS